MYILVEELSSCYDYFLRLSGFPDLFGKVFLITFKFGFPTTFLQEQIAPWSDLSKLLTSELLIKQQKPSIHIVNNLKLAIFGNCFSDLFADVEIRY